MTLAFLQNIGALEWFVILVIGLLVFGRRLPEVGRSLGKGIVEFKKGLKGIDDEVEAGNRAASTANGATLPPSGSAPVLQSPQAGGQDVRVSRADRVE